MRSVGVKEAGASSLAMAVAVLLVLLIIRSSCAATTTTSYPEFQEFNVKETIAAMMNIHRPAANNVTADKLYDEDESNGTGGGGGGGWKVKVIHRDKIMMSSSQHSQHSQHQHRLFHARMKRDAKRVAILLRRLQTPPIVASNNTTNSSLSQLHDEQNSKQDFGSDVVSGMDQGSGEYFVRIGVGSPLKSQYMVIDSGSDIVWVQCQPCNECYHQSDPIFDPANSASYTAVSCASSVCGRLQNSDCHAGRCRYQASYGDGSYTEGTLALETLTFGRALIRNVAIGCGHMNRGMFVGAAGLLGLGGGPMSFVGQLAGQTGGAFTYCLVSRSRSSAATATKTTDQIGGGGSLEFGRGAMPVGAAWVPLIRNPRAPTFYFVGLAGLGVGGIRVPISEDVFSQTESGYGGVVMDTGTAVTRFPTAAYEAFRDSFVQQTAELPRLPSGVSIFDTCYDLNGFVSVRVPTVSFYFSGGPILTLPASNFLIPVDDKGSFCFAFAGSGSPSGLSIIGNIQQEGIQVSFDEANGFVGFGPNVC